MKGLNESFFKDKNKPDEKEESRKIGEQIFVLNLSFSSTKRLKLKAKAQSANQPFAKRVSQGVNPWIGIHCLNI